MFNEGFSFKKNAWHAKLMKYIWGFESKEFTHMCPYFWLSVFNVIISPLFLPIRFIFWTIIPKFILFPIWAGFKEFCNIIDKYGKKLGETYEKWCIKQEEKWEEERKKNLISLDRIEIDKVKEIPEDVIRAIEKDYWSGINYYKYKESKKKSKKWMKWLDIFINLHKVDPESWNKIIEKKNEIAEKIQEINEKLAASIVIKKVELTEEEKMKIQLQQEEKQKRLEYQAAKQEQEEMKKHARELAKKEDERKRKELLDARRIHRMDVVRRNKERINKILKIAKPIATVFIWVVGIFAAIIGLFLVYKGIIIIGKSISSVHHNTWIMWGNIGKWIAIILGIIAFLIGIVFGIKWLVNYIKLPSINFHIPIPKRKKRKLNVGKYIPKVNIGKPMGKFLRECWKILLYICKVLLLGIKYSIWPFKQFGKGFITFLQIIKQTYKNNCPPIYWEDDNKNK
jgi:ABC-type multidrug transport system fused ATPase/permease subunit